MEPDPGLGWLEVAKDDLRQVINNLRGPVPTVTGAMYHCQQAAEKLMKAVLLLSGIEAPRTHDLGALAALVPMDDPVRDRLRTLVELTPFATAFRYPTDDPWDRPTEAEVESFLGILQALHDDIAARRS